MRGQVLIASTAGTIGGKQRPAIVVQDSSFDFADTVIVVPLTTEYPVDSAVRPLITPDERNGLKRPSIAMVNRVSAILKSEIDQIIGVVSDDDMSRIDMALLLVLGLASA
jgi:mRNA interferase MazF